MTSEESKPRVQTVDNDEQKVDLYLLKSLLEIVNNNKEDLEWILQKQNQLRIEYLTFFKKDLKEIQTSLADLQNDKIPDKKVVIDLTEVLRDVIRLFREDITKSFAIVDTRYQKVVTEKLLTQAAEMLKNDAEKLLTQAAEMIKNDAKAFSYGPQLITLIKELEVALKQYEWALPPNIAEQLEKIHQLIGS
jgi:inorganic pyrophosphatase/exopolyphosphatase